MQLRRNAGRAKRETMHIHIGHSFFGSGNFGDDLVLAGFLEGIGSVPGLRLTCASIFDTASQRRRFPQVEWYPANTEQHARLLQDCAVWLGHSHLLNLQALGG